MFTTKLIAFTAAVLSASMTLAQTQADKDAYPDYAAVFDKWGVTWEPLKVKTEDGWTLTMIHMTGKVADGPTKSAERPSLIFQHGMGGDGTEWINSIQSFLPEAVSSGKPPVAFQMMEMGFDVYLTNNSGTTYSQVNDRYTVADPEFWQMDWRKYGVYDLPAAVGEVQKRNGGKKVAFVGHSQGSTQTFAGMGLIPEWYDENISVAALLGPCALPNWWQIQDVYTEDAFTWFADNDIYVINGGVDWPATYQMIQDTAPPNVTAVVAGGLVLKNNPVQAVAAYGQASQTQRFQEYTPDWNWEVPPKMPLMDFGAVEKMKVAMYVGLFDRTCPITQAETIRKQLGENTVSHYVVAPFQGHSPWGLSSGEWFVNDLQQALMANADL